MKTLGEVLAEVEPTGDDVADGFRSLLALGGAWIYTTVLDRRRRELLELLEVRRQALAAESA